MKVVYSFLVMDLFHYGHLLHIEKAKALGDFLVIGILDNYTVSSYKKTPIMSLEERMRLASVVKMVDMVIPQFQQYPLDNMKLLHRVFPKETLICCHADDWDLAKFKPIQDYLATIGGKVMLVPYHHSVSTTSSLIEKIQALKGDESD